MLDAIVPREETVGMGRIPCSRPLDYLPVHGRIRDGGSPTGPDIRTGGSDHGPKLVEVGLARCKC